MSGRSIGDPRPEARGLARPIHSAPCRICAVPRAAARRICAVPRATARWVGVVVGWPAQWIRAGMGLAGRWIGAARMAWLGVGCDPARGSASILMLGIGLALLTIALGGQTIGAAAVARHRAGLAADLGALAGALHAPEGATVACGRARAVVRANGGTLLACSLAGTDVRATVQVWPVGPAARIGPATAHARAGPLR